jgi:uncharacterized membrane protein
VIVLAGLLAALGPGIGPPSPLLRLAVGVLSLLFGLRWLRKAILRAAGKLPLHDEQASFERARAGLAGGARRGWDAGAIAASFQVVMIEGIEVAFIVAAISAGGGARGAAFGGAGAALAVVLALGVALHRPMTRVPENSLKLAVGVMMAAFGMVCIAEAAAAPFPGGDFALPLLAVFWAGVTYLTVLALRGRRRTVGRA